MSNRAPETGYTGLQQIQRTALRVFGTVAPRAASHWFERLMLTPSLYVRKREQDSAFPEGDHTRIPYANGSLSVWSSGAGPTVLLLHGWSGRAAHLEEFVAPLRAAGFRVVALDQPFFYNRLGANQPDGMVFALEPKFVFPGQGAVGLENSYVVTADGGECLTRAPEELIAL